MTCNAFQEGYTAINTMTHHMPLRNNINSINTVVFRRI